MIFKDFKSRMAVSVAKPITTVSDNTAIVSSIIDMQNVEGGFFAILSGTLADADATFAVTMDEGETSNLADASAVSADEIITTYAAAGFTFAEDDTVKTIAYQGVKRYVRLTITPTANSGSAPFAVLFVYAPKIRGTVY